MVPHVRFWYEREGLMPPRIKAGLSRLDEPEAEYYEPEELEQRHEEIPRDRDIILYCT